MRRSSVAPHSSEVEPFALPPRVLAEQHGAELLEPRQGVVDRRAGAAGRPAWTMSVNGVRCSGVGGHWVLPRQGEEHMGMRWIATVFAVAVFASLSASAAFAGEITGNGKPTGAPDNANSICVFSGQNDVPEGDPEEGPPGRTQSYGQDVRMGLSDPSAVNPSNVEQGEFTLHPGFACNGKRGFFAGE